MQTSSAVRRYLAAIGSKGGKKGGRARTPAKIRASRINGRKGGHPKE